MMEFRVVRSKRKTMSLEITREGEVLVRAPYRLSAATVEGFVASHEAWIEKHLAMAEERKRKAPQLTVEDVSRLKAEAWRYLPERTRRLAEQFGANYSGVRINSAQTRLGSCNGKNGINYSYRLMLYSPRVIDYVIIHELAHTVEHNHSSRFWQIVARWMPDYREAEQELKNADFQYVENIQNQSV